jgi:hypothetical protein
MSSNFCIPARVKASMDKLGKTNPDFNHVFTWMVDQIAKNHSAHCSLDHSFQVERKVDLDNLSRRLGDMVGVIGVKMESRHAESQVISLNVVKNNLAAVRAANLRMASMEVDIVAVRDLCRETADHMRTIFCCADGSDTLQRVQEVLRGDAKQFSNLWKFLRILSAELDTVKNQRIVSPSLVKDGLPASVAVPPTLAERVRSAQKYARHRRAHQGTAPWSPVSSEASASDCESDLQVEKVLAALTPDGCSAST